MHRRRSASRILLISPDHRLLLFNIHYKNGPLAGRNYWATPGGGLRESESFEAAATRELYEETGVSVKVIGRCIARKQFVWQTSEGEHVLAIENYYAVRTSHEICSFKGWSLREREVVCEVRWWSRKELIACDEEFLPADLPRLLDLALNLEAD